MTTFIPIIFTPEFRQNPYPFYQSLLENDVTMVDLGRELGEYQHAFVARHEHVSSLLRDPRVVRENPSNGWTPPEKWRDWFVMTADWMLFRDPPAHTRLRGLVNKAFTPSAINQLRHKPDQNEWGDRSPIKRGEEFEHLVLLPLDRRIAIGCRLCQPIR